MAISKLISIACGLAVGLLCAAPASAQATRPASGPAGADLSVPEALQRVEEIADGIRGAWAQRDEIITAQGRLDRAQRDFRAEHRRVVMRLRQENPEYSQLQEKLADQRQTLRNLREQRREAEPRTPGQLNRRSDGQIIAPVGGTGRRVGRVMGENSNPREARRSSVSQRDGSVREQEQHRPRPETRSPAEQQAAAVLLELQTQLETIEASAIAADRFASEMQQILRDATQQWQTLEAALEEEIENDPVYKAAREELAQARQRAAPAK